MNTGVDKILARRATADGKHVCLWSDGSLTWAMGVAIKGSAHPCNAAQTDRALRAGWLVLGDVELYDADEVSSLIAAARAVAERGGDPGNMRAQLTKSAAPRMPGAWYVLATDRDGTPTERVWRFPRMSPFPDLAVWNERGRYYVARHVQDNTFSPTGPAFATLGEAFADVRRQCGVSP